MYGQGREEADPGPAHGQAAGSHDMRLSVSVSESDAMLGRLTGRDVILSKNNKLCNRKIYLDVSRMTVGAG